MTVLICAIASSSWSIVSPRPSAAGPGTDAAGEGLQAESGTEELLDDVIVQVARDPASIVGQERALRLLSGTRELDRDARTRAEIDRPLDLRGREPAVVGASGDAQHAPEQRPVLQRHRQHRARSLPRG